MFGGTKVAMVVPAPAEECEEPAGPEGTPGAALPAKKDKKKSKKLQVAQPPPPQGPVAEVLDFLKYWFSPQKSDIKRLQAKHEAMRDILGDILTGEALKKMKLKDVANLPGNVMHEAADAVVDAGDAVVNSVVQTGNEVKETIVSLGEDVVDTGKAGLDMLMAMKDFVADGVAGKTSIATMLHEANLLNNISEDMKEAVHGALEEMDGMTIDDLYTSKVDGPEAEKLMTKRWPVFIVITTAVTVLLWFAEAHQVAGKEGAVLSWMDTAAGLETIYPGETMLQMHLGCKDQRSEIYRFLSYQFSHGDVYHIGQNSAMTLLLGLPLEGFHGSWRMLLMFNLGVFGGAVAVSCWDAHSAVIGMSGGVYSLMGMHVADVCMNWHQKKYRKAVLAVLLILFIVDMINAYVISAQCASHAAHFGGYVNGIASGILLGVNLVVQRWQRRLRAVTLAVFITAFIFGLGMGMRWPPQNLWESSGSCERVKTCSR